MSADRSRPDLARFGMEKAPGREFVFQVAGGFPHGAERRGDELLRVSRAGGCCGDDPHPAGRPGRVRPQASPGSRQPRLPEAAPGPEQPRAHRRGGPVEQGADCLLGQSIKIAQDQDGTGTRGWDSTPQLSAASFGSPAGTSANSAGDGTGGRAGHPDRLPHGDRASPAVDGIRLAQPADIPEDRDQSLLGGVRAVLQRDVGRTPGPHTGQRVQESVSAIGSPRCAARTSAGSISGRPVVNVKCGAAAVNSAGTACGPPRSPPRAARRAGNAPRRVRPAAASRRRDGRPRPGFSAVASSPRRRP